MNKLEARGMYTALVLMIVAIIFFILYIQMATSMTLFALHNVRLTFLGYEVPAGVTQSLNPVFIILLSPILANLYIAFLRVGVNYNIPAKFVTGIFLAGFCFLVLAFGGHFFADANSKISVIWMVLGYAFYSLGELLVSALGASMVAKLLPQRFGGFAQGMWYLSAAIGMRLGGQLSGMAAIGDGNISDASTTLSIYVDLFYKLGFATVLIAFLLLFAIRSLSKSMQYVLDKNC